MKKIVTTAICILALCTASSAAAQQQPTHSAAGSPSQASSAVQVGLVGSLGLSSVAFQDEEPEGIGYKIGFAGGLRSIFTFSDMFGLQPEVLFVQRGFSSEMQMGDATMAHDVVHNYLQVPLLGRLNLALNDVITAKVLAGPSFGYFLSGHKPTMEMNDSGEMQMDTADIESDEMNSFEIGVAAGLGADFAAGPGSLSLDFRYDRGFTKLDDNDVAQDDAVSSGFSFLVGYNYAL